MNVIEAHEVMQKVMELWRKKESYTDDELKQVKDYLFQYYMSIQNKLKSIEIDLWK